MTWQSVEATTKSHFVDADGLCKVARDRLVEIQQDDVERIFSLRVMKRERIWGIRDGRVLAILWWDPQHEVWPSKKNN